MMKKIISVLLSVLLCFLLVGCHGDKKEYQEKNFFVMDAVLTLRLWGCDDEANAHFERIGALLSEIESALSRTDAESDVSRINRERTAGDLSPHTLSVLSTAQDVMNATAGAYLPTMGAISDLWHKAGEENALPNSTALADALAAARQGFTLEDGICTLPAQGALLDLGGIGKGYAVDCVLGYLTEAGVTGALISFGSSVATLGEKGDGTPFRISLRSPADAAATVGMLTAPEGVLSVSGDYERYVTVGGTRYHHIIDPATGYPAASGISSASVIAESGALSDALSTAFLVMGEENARTLLASGAIKAEAIFVTASGTTSHTSGLDGIFSPN